MGPANAAISNDVENAANIEDGGIPIVALIGRAKMAGK
jgi:hypothetical protein